MKKHLKKLISIIAVSALTASLSIGVIPSGASQASSYAPVETAYAAQAEDALGSYKSGNTRYSDEQIKVLTTALSLKGKIRYTWGGKASCTGWNAQWSRGTGLDCSGFVQWAFWTALGIRGGLGSTAEISGSFPSISKSQLRPGDLGLMFNGGSGYKDKNGKQYATKEAAEEANHSIAAKAVNAYLSGGGSVHASSACEKAKEAKAAYESALKKADSTDTSEAQKLKEEAKAAEEKAQKLESEAKAAEESAAAYEAQILTLQASSTMSSYSSASASGNEDDTATSSAPAESEPSSSAEKKASASEDTQDEQKTVQKKESGNSGSSSGSSSNEKKQEGGSSSGSEQPSTSRSERITEYKARAAEQKQKAKNLRSEAAGLRETAKKDRQSAKTASKKAEKKADADKELSALKEKMNSTREAAVSAEASSYKTSQNANHVGIYVGKDGNGNDLWVHCNSTNNTVSVNSFGGFHYYVRVIKTNHYTKASESASINDIVSESKKIADRYQKVSNFDELFLGRELFLGPITNKAEDQLMKKAREIRSHAVYKTPGDSDTSTR